MSPSQYESMVERSKEYIRAGDIFQVVLSQRFRQVTDAPAFEIYRALRRLNPSPYMYYLKEGTGRDMKKAVPLLRKAAEQGYAEAQFYLGSILYNGEGVPRNREEGENWLRKSAAQGHIKAQQALHHAEVFVVSIHVLRVSHYVV